METKSPMTLASISCFSEREFSGEREDKNSDFLFNNFRDPFSDTDGDAAWFLWAKNVSKSPSLVWLLIKRHENRPTLFFTNFSFWCNF